MPLAVGILAAAGLALSLTDVIQLPDLNSALARLSRGLGAWTYLLVAGLAFLETAAFVGLITPGETALALGFRRGPGPREPRSDDRDRMGGSRSG